MQLSELEYKGLNLFDEVSTVEIAIDEQRNVIHIFDKNQVVEPAYNFRIKAFELSDGFYTFVEVLKTKCFFVHKRDLPLTDWIESLTFQFYSSKEKIKTYAKKTLSNQNVTKYVHCKEDELIENKLYPKYVKRLEQDV
ncbi:aminopeptidase [Lysinibacillus sp. 54212]|uniref:aminopeptidase n=1 Tax=Lysinibacillus sp. 54212 TaxID=3119829 RepID=UPI002FC8AFF7